MAVIKGTYAVDTATINANTNIGFKLGLESSLRSDSFSAVNGVFYLTSDTHRLFIGNSDHSVSPVNQGVINVTELPSKDGVIPGQFYYIEGSNILATFNGTQWVQINPDTQVTKLEHAATAGTANDNSAKIQTTITQAGGGHTITQVVSNEVIIKGANDIVVTTDPDTDVITITDADYSFSTTGDKDAVKFNLVRDPADGEAEIESSVTFEGLNGVGITQEGNTIKVSAADAMNTITNNNIISATFSNEDPGFLLTLKKHGGDEVTATVNPQIKYGETEATINFKNGVADLDVYTITEVDNKIKNAIRDFNALTYRGTVGDSTSTATFKGGLPTSGVHNGDVFMSDGSYKHNGIITDPGTLFIAHGDEGTDGFIENDKLEWTQVQNYNTDTQTVVKTPANTNAIVFENNIMESGSTSNTVHLGSFKVVAAENDRILAVESFSDDEKKDKVITLKHVLKNYTHTPSDDSTGDETQVLYSAKALGGIGLDNWGHVASSSDMTIEVPTEIFSVVDDDVAPAKTTVTTTAVATVTGAAQSKMTGTLSDQITLKVNGGAPVSTVQMKQQFTSETLTLSTDSGALKMDLMWGSFDD